MGRLILFTAVSLLTYLYPLVFAYTDWIMLLPKMAGLWFLSLGFGFAYVTELPHRVSNIIVRIITVLIVLVPFWVFNDHLCAASEDVYFWTHKNEFDGIVEKITKENLFTTDPDAELSIYRLEGHDYMIARGSNFIAIGVKSIIDNTDGFLYKTSGDFPSFIFEGNLIFTEKIDEHWYKFSTR